MQNRLLCFFALLSFLPLSSCETWKEYVEFTNEYNRRRMGLNGGSSPSYTNTSPSREFRCPQCGGSGLLGPDGNGGRAPCHCKG